MTKAAAVLGLAGHFHLDYEDGELVDDRDLRAAIVRYVRELAPESSSALIRPPCSSVIGTSTTGTTA